MCSVESQYPRKKKPEVLRKRINKEQKGVKNCEYSPGRGIKVAQTKTEH